MRMTVCCFRCVIEGQMEIHRLKSVLLKTYRKITGLLLLCATRPKPEPPSLPEAVPLPLEACNAGPAAVPPPVTAVGGEPKVTGSDVSEPKYCEYARQ